jgi:hypothetical protein
MVNGPPQSLHIFVALSTFGPPYFFDLIADAIIHGANIHPIIAAKHARTAKYENICEYHGISGIAKHNSFTSVHNPLIIFRSPFYNSQCGNSLHVPYT